MSSIFFFIRIAITYL